MTSSRLSLSRGARDDVLAHAREGAARDPPAEVCGVLVGDRPGVTDGADATDSPSISVSAAVPVPNVADDPRVAFELDAAETLAAFEDAEERDAAVVGFYHSHPESDPTPSATDRERASWPGYVYLVCSPDGRLTAHLWTGDGFRELAIAVV